MSVAQSLYSRDVLRLATSLPYDDRIDLPYQSVTRRAPMCGSEMTVDVAVANGLAATIAIRARACALGQASAAILRGLARDKAAQDIRALYEQVRQALNGQGEMPSAYAPLGYARDYPARHGAILLPFETLLAALDVK